MQKLLQNNTQFWGWKFGARKVIRPSFIICMPEQVDTKCVRLACDRVCVSVLFGSCRRKFPCQAKVLTGDRDLREDKLTSPCLLAIPAFDRIAGLYNRHITSNWVICLHQRF